jgi:hypothetical protein
VAIRLATTSKYDHILMFYSEEEIIEFINQPKTSWDVEFVDGKIKLKQITMKLVIAIFLVYMLCVVSSSIIMTYVYSESTSWSKKVSWIEALKTFSIIYLLGGIFLTIIILIKYLI